jgi:hypothetical protein
MPTTRMSITPSSNDHFESLSRKGRNVNQNASYVPERSDMKQSSEQSRHQDQLRHLIRLNRRVDQAVQSETSSLSDTKSYGTFDSDSKSYGTLDSHCDSDSHAQYCMCYPLSSVLQAEEGIDEQDDRMSTRSRMRVRQILAICVGHFVSMTMLCGLLLFVLIFRTMNKGDGGMA